MILRSSSLRRIAFCVSLSALLLTTAALAQDPNACDEPTDEPDVVVFDLLGAINWGRVGDIHAFSVGTESCNVGTCWLNWFSGTPDHPVIGQNLFRLKDGRFEHLGQSWLKHGFLALSLPSCFNDCVATSGSHLGVHCSDPYGAGLNGFQDGLGPKFEVNATTGEFPFPPTDFNNTGDDVYKRLQVADADLDPASNVGARYFVEGQYIAADDAAAGNDDNNASYAEVTFQASGDSYNMNVGPTQVASPGIFAWRTVDPSVALSAVDVPGDGRFWVGARVTDLGDGFWSYEYAIQNLNSFRSLNEVKLGLPEGALIRNIGFHDVRYHSGEPYSQQPWAPFVVNDGSEPSSIRWSTGTGFNANALRWGTLYNFRFEADAPPADGELRLRLYEPGIPEFVAAFTQVPSGCIVDGVCGLGETCSDCPQDCDTSGAVGTCGDGLCDPSLGEDCIGCPQDCNGVQNGPAGNRFCCGDGAGTNPVGCEDARCTEGAFECDDGSVGACCGDGICGVAEDPCQCEADCGPCVETCVNDADCDDGIFCNGPEACGGGFCQPGPPPCPALCDEFTATCGECLVSSQCDDGDYCNGPEGCINGECQPGTPPCPDDGLACNGVEVCDNELFCHPTVPLCPGQQCDEPTQTCFNCNIDAHCDDGKFCNGVESCDAQNDTCLPGIPPCPGPCAESEDLCVECIANAECDDGVFCNGLETCETPGICTPAASDPCVGLCDDIDDACIGNVAPQPRPGDPLADLAAASLARFEAGRADFEATWAAGQGMGPIYNADTCVACHAAPTGVATVAAITHFGSGDGLTTFDPMTAQGGSLLQQQALSAECLETVPAGADFTSERTATVPHGAGLVEAIPDATILAAETMPPAGLSGRATQVEALESPGPLRVGRFGWKAQVPTLHSVAALEARDHLGRTSDLVPDEAAPNGDTGILAACDGQPDPEDTPYGAGSSSVERVSDYLRYLAPPPQTPRTSTNGELWFTVAGCHNCHAALFTLPDDPAIDVELRGRSFRPYSDFLLHDMGSVGDGTTQAGATPTEVRTAPLWGLRWKQRLWHDGRFDDPDFETRVLDAIAAHDTPGSEAAASAQAFQGLTQIARTNLVLFLDSLGRLEFDMNGDNRVDEADVPLVEACFTGPGSFYDTQDPCSVADSDADGDVDDDDTALFGVLVEGEAGEVPDGSAGAPLTLGKQGGGSIELQWDPSCAAGDADYAVYEGALGDFAGPVPATCSTAGATGYVLTPAAGPSYYLVVPQGATKEGSYGRDSNGVERGHGVGACLPQRIGACE